MYIKNEKKRKSDDKEARPAPGERVYGADSDQVRECTRTAGGDDAVRCPAVGWGGRRRVGNGPGSGAARSRPMERFQRSTGCCRRGRGPTLVRRPPQSIKAGRENPPGRYVQQRRAYSDRRVRPRLSPAAGRVRRLRVYRGRTANGRPATFSGSATTCIYTYIIINREDSPRASAGIPRRV